MVAVPTVHDDPSGPNLRGIRRATRSTTRRQRPPTALGRVLVLPRGHSTIVFGLAFLLSVGVKALAGQVEDDGSELHSITGIIGASVSGVFLWILGILSTSSCCSASSACSAGCAPAHYDEAELEDHLNNRGFMNRFLGGLTKSVTKSWHIYPVGVLFGLGFDTATEIGLLVLAGGAAAFNLPFYAILVLPILFAAGMCLLDTIDGVFMNFAYGWAFAKPVRKVFYNITITALSVAVALVIGTIELVGGPRRPGEDRLGAAGGIAAIALDYVGYGIVRLRGRLAGRAGGVAVRADRGEVAAACAPTAAGRPSQETDGRRHPGRRAREAGGGLDDRRMSDRGAGARTTLLAQARPRPRPRRPASPPTDRWTREGGCGPRPAAGACGPSVWCALPSRRAGRPVPSSGSARRSTTVCAADSDLGRAGRWTGWRPSGRTRSVPGWPTRRRHRTAVSRSPRSWSERAAGWSVRNPGTPWPCARRRSSGRRSSRFSTPRTPPSGASISSR